MSCLAPRHLLRPISRLRTLSRRSHSSQPDLSSLPPSVREWMNTLTSAPPRMNKDLVDLSRAQAIHATLPTRSGHEEAFGEKGGRRPEMGEELGKGWTLCYHWDMGSVQDLGEDGTSRSFNAPPPYTRRMWASGSFSFPTSTSKTKPLSIGDTSMETTRISKIEYKPKKDLVFVHQEKTYSRACQVQDRDQGGGDAHGINIGAAIGEGREEEVLVKEKRVHVFRRPVEAAKTDSKTDTDARGRPVSASTQSITPEARPPPSSSSSSAPSPSPPPTSETFEFKFTYTPTPSHLFRFSALTFNGHKIHYDPIWTREVEGHPDIVVHGPLTALLLMECVGRWVVEIEEDRNGDRDRDQGESRELGGKKGAAALRHFEYRAVSPLYADGTPITFYGRYLPASEVSEDARERSEARERQMEVWAEQGGTVGMRGMATIDL